MKKTYYLTKRMINYTALRLAKALGMSADFWINMQLRWDLYFAEQNELAILEHIEPLAGIQS